MASDEDEGHQADTIANDDYEDDGMADSQVEEGIDYFKEEDDPMEEMYV